MKKISTNVRKSKNYVSKPFLEIWEKYPRKEGRVIAYNKYERLLKEGFSHRQISDAVDAYVDYVKDRDKKYIKGGGRFFVEAIYDYFGMKKRKVEVKKEMKKTNIDLDYHYKNVIETLKAMDYQEYLITEHWKHFKLEAILFAHKKCQLCSKEDTLLHVHHKTYANRGRETFNDIIVLCEECHRLVHKK